VFHQRHDASFAASMTSVFTALVGVLARRRWVNEAWHDTDADGPLVGRRYVCRSGTVVRRGRIVECLKPVLLTLYETLVDAPCRVRLRLRWRLEPLDTGTSVLLDVRYELNGPAHLNRRQWHGQIQGHCHRQLEALRSVLTEGADQGVVGVSGQRNGSTSITVTKTTIVNGTPIFK